MRCPLCVNETLDAHFRGGIEIDICPRCRGIWLDRGELDRLVDDSAERQPPSPLTAAEASRPPRPEPPRRDDDRRPRDRDDRDDDRKKKSKKKRKKSRAEKLVDLLEDVFD